MRLSSYFVTGTGTDVGKTSVSCGIVAAARARGMTVAVSKPVESGCSVREGELWPSDAAALAAAAGGAQSLRDVCPYRFEEAVAPGVAAQRVGDRLALPEIESVVAAVLATGAELSLVEGAGGLLVPLAGDHLISDLAASLQLPLVIVGLAGLGTINHTLQTVEVARSRGLEVAGVVLNHATTDVSDAAAASNAAEIRRFGAVEVIGIFPHCSTLASSVLAAAAEQNLALDQLFHVER